MHHSRRLAVAAGSISIESDYYHEEGGKEELNGWNMKRRGGGGERRSAKPWKGPDGATPAASKAWRWILAQN